MRDLGWDSLFVADVGLAGRSDEDVFAYAWRHQRIILTHDQDFMDDSRFPFNRNPGIIVLPGANGGIGLIEALRGVISLVGRFGEAHFGEKIEISADQIWKIRGWDKERGIHYKRRYRFQKHDVLEWKDGA